MEREYEKFYIWAKKYLDLDLNSYKQKQLTRRINTVREKSGAKNLEEYADLLTKDKEQREIFLNYITINVTEFFRNREIFKDFEEAILEYIVPNSRNIKIWSAACSIGSEPYTLSMIMDKNNLLNRAKIIATDIDDEVLLRAKKGKYSSKEVETLKGDEVARYFDKDGVDYTVKDYLKNIINFKKHDLILDSYEKNFDAIICRNVTIYFKDETKDKIYKRMSESLTKGGILFTGATESIHNPEEYGLVKLKTFIYQKV